MSSCHSHFELSMRRILTDRREKPVLSPLLGRIAFGGETVADMARFGQLKLGLLQRFRPFANATPSQDQLGISLAKLDPVASRAVS